jgi:hypothetical protein
MAANVSLLDLRTWARQLSATQNNPNITDAELTALANRHASELWDRLVDAGPPDYFASTTQVTTTADLIPYALPADFRNLVEVYVRENSSGKMRRLMPMPQGSRANYKAPSAVYTLDVEYIPTADVLTADGDTLDGVSGWGELIANMMARDVMIKRESDPSIVMNNIARLEARITARSRKRDRSPKRTVDLDEIQGVWTTSPWRAGMVSTSALACYRLRAGNLELYEPSEALP